MHEDIVPTEQSVSKFIDNLPDTWNAKYRAESKASYDGILEITLGKKTHLLYVSFKKFHRKESIHYVSKSSKEFAYKPFSIYFTNPLTNYLKEECEKYAINFIDENGNARIMDNDIFVAIDRISKTANRIKPSKVMSDGIIKCVFAMISEPDLVSAKYKNIAEKANVSVSMANKAINFLIEHKHIPKEKSKRRFLDKGRIMYEWLISYDRFTVNKHDTAYYPPISDWKDFQIPKCATWGGEVAAAQLINYIKPARYTLYAFDKKLPRYPILSNTDNPPLVVLEPFWGKALTLSETAKALLTIGDLLASKDGRNREVAEMINDKYLQIKALPQY